MAYTIIKSDGTVLTTIPDGTINTTVTSLGLPGRNYAGYGQAVDTNFVRQLENFASSTPPANPLRGQLWFNTNNSTMYVCPIDGESNALAWLSLTSTSSGGTSTFGNLTVTGNVAANNVSVTNTSSANLVNVNYLTVTANANVSNANIVTAYIGTANTAAITSGNATTAGTLTGVWTVNGGDGTVNSSAVVFNTGGITISNSAGANLYGIRCDKYMYANGTPINFAGSYGNSNVAAYLPVYGGNIATVRTTATILTTGANTTAGTITGNWTLSAGSRMQATYADLGERQHTDAIYPVGTVVKVGGINEVTQVQSTDSVIDVLGVVSNTAAYVMNATAGDDDTHPVIALVGRVPVRVVGPVTKGDRLTIAGNGCARVSSNEELFGWALESSTADDEKLILSVIK